MIANTFRTTAVVLAFALTATAAAQKNVYDDPSGGDCAAALGGWDAGTKVCTLTHDVLEPITIQNDGVTLRGAGYRVGSVRAASRNNVTIEAVTITSGASPAIAVDGGTGNKVVQSYIKGSTDGISAEGSSALTIQDTEIVNATNFAIDAYGASGALIKDNLIHDDSPFVSNRNYGIFGPYGGNNNTVSGNHIEDSRFCIYGPSSNASHNVISGNTTVRCGGADQSGDAIHGPQNGSDWNTITDNTITDSIRGVYPLGTINNNVISHNTFLNNANAIYGLFLAGTGNQVFNNDITSIAGQQAPYYFDAPATGFVFNLPAPIGGNYYSVYSTSGQGCFDVAPADGFCDAPYTAVLGRATDFLPWTAQSGWVTPPDSVPPSAAPTQSPAANAGGWNNTDVSVDWRWTDNAGGSGIDAAHCTASSGSAGEGVLTLSATCQDLAGNVAPTATYSVKVDKTAPVASPSATTYGDTVYVFWNWSDGGSGLPPQFADGADCPLYSTSSGQSTIAFSVSCSDLAGNVAVSSYAIDLSQSGIYAFNFSLGSGYFRYDAVSRTIRDVAYDFGALGHGYVSSLDASSTASVFGNPPSAAVQQNNTFLGLIGGSGYGIRLLSGGGFCVRPDADTCGVGDLAQGTYSIGRIPTSVAPSTTSDPVVVAVAEAVDANNQPVETEIVLTFSNVTSAGSVNVTVFSSPPPDVPSWLSVGSDSVFAIEPTFTFDGSVQVCIGYGSLDPTGLRLYHGHDGTWTDVTDADSPNEGTRQICGHTTSFSTFALARVNDTTPPILSPTIQPSASLLLNASASATPHATDGESGVATQTCGPVDTTTPGQHTVTCNATDRAGNSASVQVGYTVGYTFQGFLAPVDNPPLINTGKAGRTYPVKWQLRDANNAFVGSLAAVASVSVSTSGGCSGQTAALETTTTGATSLRYDATANQYVYNWATPSQPGCYRLTLTLAGGQAATANFSLSK